MSGQISWTPAVNIIRGYCFGWQFTDTKTSQQLTRTKWTNGIRYENGDITKTRFTENHFDFITCLSVIEHGVNVHAFLDEMIRILKPGGFLLVSTDYCEAGISTLHKLDFSRAETEANHEVMNMPYCVFSKTEIEDLIAYAKSKNISLVEIPRLDCKDLPCFQKNK